MPHTELAVVLERMVSNRSVAANLPRIRELEARFREAGIGNAIELVGRGHLTRVCCPRRRARLAVARS